MDDEKAKNTIGKRLSQDFIAMRLALIEYAITHTLDELLTQSLDEVGTFVDSPIGFYHFVEPDQKTLSLQQWSTRTLKEFCRAAGKGIHYNIDQAGVWVDCLRQKKPVIHNDYSSLPHKKGMPEGHPRVVRELVVPVIREDKAVAILGVGNKPTDYTQRDVGIVAYLADVIWEIIRQKRAEEALKKTTADLHERIKELSCLYGISRLVEENLSIDEFMQRTVELIPPSWQYPEITCARIRLNNQSYRTKQFIKTKWVLTQRIRVNKEDVGLLEVFLLEKKPEKDEGPFLIEERNLLNAISGRLGHIVEHKRADEALRKAHDKLQARVEERTKELAIQNMQLLNEIKERRKMEEELQKSSEKIKLFAYSVVHDLRNPVISIQGLARILNKNFGNQLTARGKKFCEQILRSSDDIASLVEKINIIISAKETQLDVRKVSLKEIFLLLHEEFSSHLDIRSIQWSTSEKIPDYMVADRLSIIRIFRNIVDNSLKYGGDGLGRIAIGYRSTEDFHIFTVTDDGQGLTDKNAKNIFNWFRRLTDAKEIQGIGIGLAIVKEIATLHGGEVWHEPAEPKGITFCVSLSRHLVPREDS